MGEQNTYKIAHLEAAVIQKYQAAGMPLPLYEDIRNNGRDKQVPRRYLFTDTLDYNYETEKLEQLYRDSMRKAPSVTRPDDDPDENGEMPLYTDAIIRVDFDDTLKNYNLFGRLDGYDGSDGHGGLGRLYLRCGWAVRKKENGSYEAISNKGQDRVDLKLPKAGEKGSIIYKTYQNETDAEPIAWYFSEEKIKELAAKKSKKASGRKSPENDTSESQEEISAEAEAGLPFISKNEMSLSELREKLFRNGFDCIDSKGKIKHYVRYKRSSGMSRDGKCYFILEKLKKPMRRWSDLGFDTADAEKQKLKEHGLKKNTDPVSQEAYTALTLSSLEGKVEIPLSSILFLKDADVCFTDEVIAVDCEEDNGAAAKKKVKSAKVQKTTAAEKTIHSTNTIWDGEALLDVSIFEKAGLPEKGMLLLRNRYFKSAAFNTNLQKWFSDNGITNVSQLNGYTQAKLPENIRMVVTDSSLKFLKMFTGDREKKIDYWIDCLKSEEDGTGELFGIVKTEKATHFLDGNYVKTNYQMLNTLDLTEADAEKLLKPSAEVLGKICRPLSEKEEAYKTPDGMRYYLDCMNSFTEGAEGLPDSGNSFLLGYKEKLMSALLEEAPGLAAAQCYRKLRHEIVYAKEREQMLGGRLLVHGCYATLFGNGMELLYESIKKDWKEKLWLGKGQVYCKLFADGARLACARSPHITMGNLFAPKNKKNDDIDIYFNLSPYVVCVNSRGDNLLQRLNGADFDSDTMLLTDNPVLYDTAQKASECFKVPVNMMKPETKTYTSGETETLQEIDHAIANNIVGEIVNLSQRLNSIYWIVTRTKDSGMDKYMRAVLYPEVKVESALAEGDKERFLKDLYKDICILAVLSNTEIDKAKRMYPVSAQAAVNAIQAKYVKNFTAENDCVIPEFWKTCIKADANKKNVKKSDESQNPSGSTEGGEEQADQTNSTNASGKQPDPPKTQCPMDLIQFAVRKTIHYAKGPKSKEMTELLHSTDPGKNSKAFDDLLADCIVPTAEKLNNFLLKAHLQGQNQNGSISLDSREITRNVADCFKRVQSVINTKPQLDRALLYLDRCDNQYAQQKKDKKGNAVPLTEEEKKKNREFKTESWLLLAGLCWNPKAAAGDNPFKHHKGNLFYERLKAYFPENQKDPDNYYRNTCGDTYKEVLLGKA